MVESFFELTVYFKASKQALLGDCGPVTEWLQVTGWCHEDDVYRHEVSSAGPELIALQVGACWQATGHGVPFCSQ